MSGPTTTRRGGDGRWIGGLILILIGAGLLAGQFVPDIGRYAPLVVGLGLLIIFLFTRNAGALIGGAIVTGIGVGLLLDDPVPGIEGGAWIPLCLGLGFLGIWVFGGLLRMPEARFWPLIPGGILTFVGIVALGGLSSDFGQYLWPAVLIFIGLVTIVRQPATEARGAEPDDGTGSAARRVGRGIGPAGRSRAAEPTTDAADDDRRGHPADRGSASLLVERLDRRATRPWSATTMTSGASRSAATIRSSSSASRSRPSRQASRGPPSCASESAFADRLPGLRPGGRGARSTRPTWLA